MIALSFTIDMAATVSGYLLRWICAGVFYDVGFSPEAPMSSFIDRVDGLDLSLFDRILSQTTDDDKRSLLAVQRAVAKAHRTYTYLEIGSHLGGSIQPHLVDARCTRIYSIDPRPTHAPDDRSEGHVSEYEDNSTKRMLDLLSAIDSAAINKIICFDQSGKDVDRAKIDPKPQLAFVDGEHTNKAAIEDYSFCIEVIANDGVILFHDAWIIYPAILAIHDRLRHHKPTAVPLFLAGSVFGIFLDPNLIFSDASLRELYQQNKNYFRGFRMRSFLRKYVPSPIWAALKKAKHALKARSTSA
jgi:Methyltransferase domain